MSSFSESEGWARPQDLSGPISHQLNKSFPQYPVEGNSHSLRDEPAIASSHLLQFKKQLRHRKILRDEEIVLNFYGGGIYATI